MIEEFVAPVFHKKLAPLAPDTVRTAFPQLFTTATDGAAGMAKGAVTPVAAALVQPFTVCVTV